MEKFKAIRGQTICQETENGNWNNCSFILPTKLDYRVDNKRIVINFYAKKIELKIGDIIHAYWGTAYKIVGGDNAILEVEEIK